MCSRSCAGRAAATLILGVLAACRDPAGVGPLPGSPAAIAVVSGDRQTAESGATLGNPLVVRVTDARGQPLGNRVVSWRASSGSLLPSASLTDADGLVRAAWQVGALPGMKTATATVAGGVSEVAAAAVATVVPPQVVTVETIEPGRVLHGAVELHATCSPSSTAQLILRSGMRRGASTSHGGTKRGAAGRPPLVAVLRAPRYRAFSCAIQRRTLSSSTPRGMEPLPRTTSWKRRTSNFGPSSRSAVVLSSRIFICPVL